MCDEHECWLPFVRFNGISSILTPTLYVIDNAIARRAESELLPALRTLGIAFQARSVLAGGLLSGAHMSLPAPKPGSRLAGSCDKTTTDSCTGSPRYTQLFWSECYQTAVDRLALACAESDPFIEPAGAAVQWLARHSALDPVHGDSLIIGASSVKQLNGLMTAVAATNSLPDSVLEALDAGWEQCKSGSPSPGDGW